MQKSKDRSEQVPEAGELVIGNVTKVFPYGAFVSLEEYAGKEGMIHISEISSKWIKNIKDHVTEGQKIVVKVIRINREKNRIDLSLKSVKALQKKMKLDQYKKENRAAKLLELAGNKLKDIEKISEIRAELENKFGGIYEPLELAVKEGTNAFKEVDIPDNWKKALAEIAKDSIEIPRVSIKATFELESKASNGIEIIKGSLTDSIKNVKEKELEISIKYIAAPRYRIEVSAPDYKVAEKALEKISSEVIETVTKNKGTAKLVR